MARKIRALTERLAALRARLSLELSLMASWIQSAQDRGEEAQHDVLGVKDGGRED